jgi:folate-binding protein YgfZ
MISRDEHRSLHEDAGLADRSARGRLVVSGADRRQYLQGLLTNDIEALTPGSGCYAAFLTAQGRMIADMHLFETGSDLLVTLDGRLASDIHERWAKFVFSEDVQIADVSAQTGALGLYGPASARVLSTALAKWTALADAAPSPDELASMPLHANRRWPLGESRLLVIRTDDLGVSGFDIVLPLERTTELGERLRDAGAASVAPETLEACRIEAGRPLFGTDMDESTIPLEAGIEDRAISLTKGCYVGQEIIIRVLHRGHGRVARRLVGITLDPSSAVPGPGDVLRSGDRHIGSVTSAVRSPALDRPIALGYVHRDFVEPGTVVTIEHGGATYAGSVSQLPFRSRG